MPRGEEVQGRLARSEWSGRECRDLRSLWERVDERAASHHGGKRRREGAGVKDVCDVLWLARGDEVVGGADHIKSAGSVWLWG